MTNVKKCLEVLYQQKQPIRFFWYNSKSWRKTFLGKYIFILHLEYNTCFKFLKIFISAMVSFLNDLDLTIEFGLLQRFFYP